MPDTNDDKRAPGGGPRPTGQPSVTIIESVADAEGVAPVELPPLGDTIDPDALDTLVASMPRDGGDSDGVRFRFAGYNVTVCPPAEIRIAGGE